MKKEKIIGLGVLSLFLIAGISTAFANGFGGADREARQASKEEHKAQMEEIMESGTYSDWVNFSNQNFEEKVTQMRERHAERTSKINSENWDKFVEAHQLMVNGDREGAQAIFEEMGIEKGMGQGAFKGKGQFSKGGCPRNNQQ